MVRPSSYDSALDVYERKSQWRGHRARVNGIQSSHSVSPFAFFSALATSAHPNRIHTNNQSTPASYNQKHDIQKHLALIQTLLVQPTFDSNQNEKNTIVVSKFNHPLTRSSHALYTRHSATVKNNFVEFNASTMQYTTDATSAGIRVRARRHTTIRNENMKLKTRILNTQATIDPIVLKRHEENHLAMRRIRSRHQIKKKSSRF